MANDILDGATNQFNFPELPNSRIILSEEVYTRLLGDINLCAFSGNKELEYGTFLYGKEIKPNVIYFYIPSKYDDYEPRFREFEVNTDKYGNELNMHKELMYNINQSKYDCIAHVHTHPYIGGTCRFFSNQDLRTIQIVCGVSVNCKGGGAMRQTKLYLCKACRTGKRITNNTQP